MQNSMALIALVAASQASGFSIVESSVIGSCLFLAAALSAIWKGKVVDQQGRGVIVRQAQVLAVVFTALLVAFLLAPWWVAAAGALLLGSVRFNPAALQQALWSEIHRSEEKLARAMAWENSVSFMAQIVGPLLAALVVWQLGGYGALLVAGVLSVFSMGLWGMLAPAGKAERTPSQRFLFAALPVVASLFILFFSAGILQGILLHQEGGALLLALYTGGAALAGLYFFRRSLPSSWRQTALSLGPLLLFGAALSWNTPLFFPVLLLGGALFSAGSLAANMKIKALAPRDRLNEAFALPLIAGPMGISLGVLASGFLVSVAWQLPLALLALVCVLLISVLCSDLLVKLPHSPPREHKECAPSSSRA